MQNTSMMRKPKEFFPKLLWYMETTTIIIIVLLYIAYKELMGLIKRKRSKIRYKGNKIEYKK